MSEDAGDTNSGDPQDSPYRPPVIVEEEPGERAVQWERRPSIPIVWIGLYAMIATAVNSAAIFVVDITSSGELIFLTIICVPIVLSGLFCVPAMSVIDSSSPAAAMSMTWKIFMAACLAPAAMIVFVPTCVATTISLAAVTGFGFGGGQLFFFAGVFAGYFVTCYLIALWLRRRVSSREVR